MILRAYNVWLVPAALALLGFGPGAAKAIAQTTYPFSGNYDTVVNIQPITDDVSQVFESGVSTDAPYGLTEYQGLVYAQIAPDNDPTTDELSFNSDPAKYGLEGYPYGYIVFEGDSSSNKLFGTADATTKIDYENLTAQGSGILNITGGEGIFNGASGVLDFSENDIVPLDPSDPLIGKALVSGSIEAVPEPGAGIGTLVGMGAIAAGFLLRQRSKATTVSTYSQTR